MSSPALKSSEMPSLTWPEQEDAKASRVHLPLYFNSYEQLEKFVELNGIRDEVAKKINIDGQARVALMSCSKDLDGMEPVSNVGEKDIIDGVSSKESENVSFDRREKKNGSGRRRKQGSVFSWRRALYPSGEYSHGGG